MHTSPSKLPTIVVKLQLKIHQHVYIFLFSHFHNLFWIFFGFFKKKCVFDWNVHNFKCETFMKIRPSKRSSQLKYIYKHTFAICTNMHIYLKPFNLSQSQFHCHFLSHSVRNTYQLHWMNYLPRNNRKTNGIRSYDLTNDNSIWYTSKDLKPLFNTFTFISFLKL